jgi:hypothetical protein
MVRGLADQTHEDAFDLWRLEDAKEFEFAANLPAASDRKWPSPRLAKVNSPTR